MVGFCAIVWLVERISPTLSVRYRRISLVNQIMPFVLYVEDTVVPLSAFILTIFYLFSVSYCGLASLH